MLRHFRLPVTGSGRATVTPLPQSLGGFRLQRAEAGRKRFREAAFTQASKHKKGIEDNLDLRVPQAALAKETMKIRQGRLHFL